MRTAIFAFFLLAAQMFAAAPFTMNGWQFHDYDVPKLTEAIKRAPQYGVNFFIFSHGLFESVEEFLSSPERQRDVLRLGALADQQKIPYYLWVHEFDDIPEKYRVGARTEDAAFSRAISMTGSGSSASFRLGSRVNMDDPAIMEYLRQRYERLLAKCPNAAGLVLTFHESDNKIFRSSEVQSKLTVPDRIYTISKLLYDVVKKHNKKLIIRNFFYEPQEMAFLTEAMGKLPDDVISMSKDTCHEFHPFYPADPMHGKFGKKLHIMEPDLGVEKAWNSQGPYAQIDYIRKYVVRARDTGMAGAVGRAHFFGNKPWEDTHEINFYAFSRFMKDPDLSVDTVLNDWAKLHYPAEAAPYIASALKRTEFIQHHGRWFLGFWLTKSIGAEWDDYPYYFGHILLRSNYKWTKDPADKQMEQGLYNPDRALYNKLIAEKDEVIRQVRASTADMRQAARFLSPEQNAPLQEGFRWLADAAELQREWTRAFFAMRMWMKDPSEEYQMIVQDALAKMETMDKLAGVDYGRDPRTGHRYNIDKFALEMRWRMANRQRALQEDQRILEEINRLMEVDKN